MPSVIDALFGCWHSSFTFPQKHKTFDCDYVVCLECGDEFAYDMNAMSVQQKLPKSYQHTTEPSVLERIEQAVVATERVR